MEGEFYLLTRQPLIKEMVLIALFATLTAVGAFIKINLLIIPFTLQTFFVFLSGNILPAKQAAYAQALYLGIGLLGFPILANGGGIGYVFQPSFGFLVGNILAAYVIGSLASRKSMPSTKQLFAANLVGMVMIYSVGLVYFYGVLNFWLDKPTSWSSALSLAVLPFIIPDLLKCALAAWIGKNLQGRVTIQPIKKS